MSIISGLQEFANIKDQFCNELKSLKVNGIVSFGVALNIEVASISLGNSPSQKSTSSNWYASRNIFLATWRLLVFFISTCLTFELWNILSVLFTLFVFFNTTLGIADPWNILSAFSKELKSSKAIGEFRFVVHWNIWLASLILLALNPSSKIICEVLKFRKNLEESSGSVTVDLSSILAICSVVSWSVIARASQAVLEICQLPWTVRVCVGWSQTPSTCDQRLKVWLGTLTAAEVRRLDPPPNKKKLRRKKISIFQMFFIIFLT